MCSLARSGDHPARGLPPNCTGGAVALAFASEGADVIINYLGSEEVAADETIRLIESAGRRRPSDITCSALPRKRLPLCLRLPSRSTRVERRRVPHPLAPGAQSGTSML